MISSSHSSGSSGPRPSSSFLISSIRRLAIGVGEQAAFFVENVVDGGGDLGRDHCGFERLELGHVDSLEQLVMNFDFQPARAIRDHVLAPAHGRADKRAAGCRISAGRPPLVTFDSRSFSPMMNTSLIQAYFNARRRPDLSRDMNVSCACGQLDLRHHECARLEHRARDRRRRRNLE